MKTKKLTVPLMDKGEHGNRNLNGTCVVGRSRELLLEIKSLLEVFAPSGDDHRHGLWIEVPRGKPEDWCSFRDAKCYYNEDIKTREDYLDEWEKWNPQESQWYSCQRPDTKERLICISCRMIIGGACCMMTMRKLPMSKTGLGTWNRLLLSFGRKFRPSQRM